MSRTYRASERNKIEGRKKRAKLPRHARRLDKAHRINKLEIAASKRGESLDSRYYAMCHGKVRYSKEGADEKVANWLNGLVVAYKCDYCIHYHVGRKGGKFTGEEYQKRRHYNEK